MVNPQKPDSIIFCTKESDIPKVKHWAIIEGNSCSMPGYDRFEPSSTMYYIQYKAFLNKEEWEKEIKKRIMDRMTGDSFGRSNFRAIEVNPVNIETNINIKID